MRQGEKVVLLEFNELSPRLMDRFIGEGKLPGFERMRNESHAWITDAEESEDTLEPWIQWVTVHTGLPYAEHGVFRLDEADACAAPRLWDLIAREHGGTSWICGSMNAGCQDGFGGHLLPDPWSTRVNPRPAGEFDTYYRFIRAHVQEYTNDKVPLSRADQLRFVGWMAMHGLSWRTIRAVAGQLADERRANVRWRRANVCDLLQWDVFRHYYRKLKPTFATFFLNSTAHLQHAYWRNLEPELFSVQPGEQEQADYGMAVEYGYRSMDRLVSQCLDMAGGETTVMLATALSQQPCLSYEAAGGKNLHRPRDIARLLQFAGISGVRPAPVMSEQFHLRAGSESQASSVACRLRSLQVDGRPAMHVEQKGSNVFTGCKIFDRLPAQALLQGALGERPFFDIFYRADVLKSGRHHPEGLFWIRRPDREAQVHAEKASIRSIAPTVLDILGIAEKPSVMRAPSLLQTGEPVNGTSTSIALA